MEVLFDGGLPVHYRFFSVGSSTYVPADLAEPVRGQRNGLCGAAVSGGLSMITGLHTGEVSMRIEWSAAAPSIDDGWEDVVEVAVEFGADLSVASFAWWRQLQLPQPGSHRARYCCSAMDAGADADSTEPGEASPDRYLLQLWPAASEPEVIIREGSNAAGYWAEWARSLS